MIALSFFARTMEWIVRSTITTNFIFSRRMTLRIRLKERLCYILVLVRSSPLFGFGVRRSQLLLFLLSFLRCSVNVRWRMVKRRFPSLPQLLINSQMEMVYFLPFRLRWMTTRVFPPLLIHHLLLNSILQEPQLQLLQLQLLVWLQQMHRLQVSQMSLSQGRRRMFPSLKAPCLRINRTRTGFGRPIRWLGRNSTRFEISSSRRTLLSLMTNGRKRAAG